jgi:hypothetical protein
MQRRILKLFKKLIQKSTKAIFGIIGKIARQTEKLDFNQFPLLTYI